MQLSKKSETADFERAPNQGSLLNGLPMDELDRNKSSRTAETSKEKRFLLSELHQIKEQLH